MLINLQNSRKDRNAVYGAVSAGLSLIILMVFVWAWIRPEPLEKAEKIQVKQNLNLSAQYLKNKPMPLRVVTLPAPPEIEKQNKVVHQSKVTEKKLIKRLKPTSKGPKLKTDNKIPRPNDENIVTIASTLSDQGRVLLRLLEHGSGPVIEFAWPETSFERQRLYKVLTECHAMRVAVLDEQDRLFVRESQRGMKWQINLDQYSTFMRQISGRSVKKERLEVSAIRQRQLLAGKGTAVRIFSRKMDSYVLGGVGRILGSGYRSKRLIRAKYELSNSAILVTNIVADGVAQRGVVKVPCHKANLSG